MFLVKPVLTADAFCGCAPIATSSYVDSLVLLRVKRSELTFPLSFFLYSRIMITIVKAITHMIKAIANKIEEAIAPVCSELPVLVKKYRDKLLYTLAVDTGRAITY